ncbi:PhoH family protein [Desulfovibrio sp. OttesenSCG-928-A18]|nr:PhoH family protein [Desulfovibrio sp. OttesenSCG-928-A18]
MTQNSPSDGSTPNKSDSSSSALLPPYSGNEAELALAFDDTGYANELFGPQNANLKSLAQVAGLRLLSRGSELTIKGDAARAELASKLLTQLYSLLRSGVRLQPGDVAHAYGILERSPGTELRSLFQDAVLAASSRKTVVAKTLSQREYVDALRHSDMTFAVGPAGTGKTYLAVAVALSMLFAKKVRRIILTRPAVEAGERLGFLPGDLADKVNPYLRPLFDALHDMLDAEKAAEMIESGIIEIAPLAFMRGRTLNDAFIILDEAQNTTREQMKMFVTRLGFGSHAAITGDITQIDLPALDGPPRSGLVHALEVLHHVEGIRIVRFGKEDVIRHPLVGRIVDAYDCYEKHTR